MATDVLSDVLSAIRLTGSAFFDVAAASPWVAEAPPSAEIAEAVMPGAQHVIEYHAVTSGTCWITLLDGAPFEPVQLHEGDIAVIPQGEAHAVSSAPAMRAAPEIEAHRRPADESCLPFRIMVGHDGPSDARLICGFFACDVRPFNPLIGALPRFMKIGRSTSPAADVLMGQVIAIASADIARGKAGAQGVLNKLSELLFIEAIRSHMEQLGSDEGGWLAGLRDPLVGRAMALIHAEPARDWTLAALAAQAGASRSALAARQLSRKGAKVAAVAQAVGYDSEAAFSRAFKKFAGQPPGEWRAQ